MKRAREFLEKYLTVDHWDKSTFSLYEPELAKVIRSPTTSLAERQVAMIRLCPRVLQHSEHGPALLAILVDLLESARFGSKTKAALARKALALLVPVSRGNPVGFGAVLLAQILYGLSLALAELQPFWRASFGEPIAARLAAMRETFGAELEDFSDKEPQPLLNDDLPAAAARVAEKATGIASEAFLRAWNQSAYLRGRLEERLRQ
jgi:hypothetical protein